MKLRIKDNSIRLRLSQSECDRLREDGEIRTVTPFGGSADLMYGLQASECSKMEVSFAEGKIFIVVPSDIVETWCNTDLVGFDDELLFADGQSLSILVEKDFKCLTERAGEDESDLFPNPLESH